MNLESSILIFLWIIGILAMVLFVPKNRRRKFSLAFLVVQAFEWLSTMFLVQWDVILFPEREFPKATELLFTTEYFFIPLLCGFYIIYEPKANIFIRIGYLLICTLGVTIMLYFIEKYSNLIHYVNYTWYWSWIHFFLLFSLTNLIYRWFFKDKSLFQADKRIIQ